MDFPNGKNYFFIYDYKNGINTHKIPEHLHEYIIPFQKYFPDYPYNVSDKKVTEKHDINIRTNNVSKMTTSSKNSVKCSPAPIRQKYFRKMLSDHLNNIINTYLDQPWEDDVESRIVIFPRNEKLTYDKQINEHKNNIIIKYPISTSQSIERKKVTGKQKRDANKEDRYIRNSKRIYPIIKQRNTTKEIINIYDSEEDIDITNSKYTYRRIGKKNTSRKIISRDKNKLDRNIGISTISYSIPKRNTNIYI